MLQPSRTKFRKAFKGRIKGNAKGGTEVSFGEYGLKAIEPNRVTAREIESARRAMTRSVSRGGRVWVLMFPDVPVTKKPAEVRMGSGKGGLEYYVCRVKPGRILFEMAGVSEAQAKEAFRLAAMKLSVRTKMVARHHGA